MFISLRSPKGGGILSGIWTGLRGETNAVIDNTSSKPTIVGDYVVWKIGYAFTDMKAGEPICIKRSDALRLYNLLKFIAD